MHLSTIAVLVSGVAASTFVHNHHHLHLEARQGGCAPTTEVDGKKLTGPFALTAGGGGGDSWNGKYVKSLPPDGSCCSNFFVFGIPGDRAKEEATDFYLNEAGNLLSVQGGVTLSAFNGQGTDASGEPTSHVLLGAGDSISGPLITCKVDGGCGLSCSAGGAAYNCLASPGYQPDWRISDEQAGAGVGCATFTPTMVEAVRADAKPDAVSGAASASSASVSVSASASSMSISASASSASVSVSVSASASADAKQTPKFNPAKPSGAASGQAQAAGNAAAVQTAAPLLAFAAVGILAAL